MAEVRRTIATGPALLACWAVTLAGLAGCERTSTEAPAEAAASTAYQPPTESAAARLQDECDSAGRSILMDAKDDATSQTVRASYSATTNQCHIELIAHPVDPARALDQQTRSVFDGQGRLLGSATIDGARHSALILSNGTTDFDAANLFLDGLMSRE